MKLIPTSNFVLILWFTATITSSKVLSKSKAYSSMSSKGFIRGGQMVSTDASLSNVVELKTPIHMFANAVAVGTTKANMSPLKIFVLGIMSGCHIALGSLAFLLGSPLIF